MQESQAITRKSASNLALAFILLPKEKRDGMSALYAFCREVDDVADEDVAPVEVRRAGLKAWRTDVALACQPDGKPQFAVNRELQSVIARYTLPFHLFDELIQGCEMDLGTLRYPSYEALENYCYHVASVVGLLSIEIFGYKNPATRQYALHLGQALQLTNILRDVRVDALRNRIYLPKEELDRFGVAEEEILTFRYSDRFRQLAESVARRANFHYQKAQTVLPAQDRHSMVAAEVMGSVYWKLLKKLESRNFDVLGPQLLRLNKLQKMHLVARTWCRNTLGVAAPNYGSSLSL